MVSAADLARQVKEAEDLVRRLERGETATPKDSQPVRRNVKFGTGPNLTPLPAHLRGGFAGKSLIEMIRDDLRETIEEFETEKLKKIELDDPYENEYLDGLIDGMCHALGILRGNEGSVERQWAEAEYRETKRREAENEVSEQDCENEDG